MITFTDISEIKRIRKALEKPSWKRAGEQSQVTLPRSGQPRPRASRSRPSPSCRGCSPGPSRDDKARNLVKRLDGTLHAMSGMLNTLLDINQIEAGIIRATIVPTALNEDLRSDARGNSATTRRPRRWR